MIVHIIDNQNQINDFSFKRENKKIKYLSLDPNVSNELRRKDIKFEDYYFDDLAAYYIKQEKVNYFEMFNKLMSLEKYLLQNLNIKKNVFKPLSQNMYFITQIIDSFLFKIVILENIIKRYKPNEIHLNLTQSRKFFVSNEIKIALNEAIKNLSKNYKIKIIVNYYPESIKRNFLSTLINFFNKKYLLKKIFFRIKKKLFEKTQFLFISNSKKKLFIVNQKYSSEVDDLLYENFFNRKIFFYKIKEKKTDFSKTDNAKLNMYKNLVSEWHDKHAKNFKNKKIKSYKIFFTLRSYFAGLFFEYEKYYDENYYFITKKILLNKPNFLINNRVSSKFPLLAASIFKEKKMPVISISHGGGIGTHRYEKNLFHGDFQSDYLIHWSKRLNFPKNIPLNKKLTFVPMGSSLIKENTKKILSIEEKGEIEKILFISDSSEHFSDYNFSKHKHALNYIFSYQSNFFKILYKKKNLNITYRPVPRVDINYKMRDDIGIVKYLKKNFIDIIVDNKTNIYKQIKENDLIITDSVSGTITAQVISMKKKMVIFSDKRITPLYNEYIKDLKKVSYLCTSREKFLKAANLVSNKKLKITTKKKNYDNFIEKYIYPKENKNFIKFLNNLPTKKNNI